MLAEKLPLGKTDFDRHDGWMTLVVVGSGVEPSSWRKQISDALADIGWRAVRSGVHEAPSAYNSTFELLDFLVRGLQVVWYDPRSDQELEPTRTRVAALARSAVLEPKQV